MHIKNIATEDFVNYKLPSMFISTCFCNWKCCTEQNLDASICQNSALSQAEIINLPDEYIYKQFVDNPITKAVVIGGLEPFIQANEVIPLIDYFRKNGVESPFIIYTGYYPSEISKEIEMLKQYKNIIIKFGRYVPNQTPHYDEVLGVELVSDNQYAEVIS